MELGYIPALRYLALTAWYDVVMNWTMRESTLKDQRVQQAHIEPGQQVLDVGCGTGTLSLLAKAQHLDATVIGIDSDPQVLEFAKTKSRVAGLAVRFQQAMSLDLPFADASFDRILSSLLFYHLSREAKARTLKEAARVLHPDGELHIAEWGQTTELPFQDGLLLRAIAGWLRIDVRLRE